MTNPPAGTPNAVEELRQEFFKYGYVEQGVVDALITAVRQAERINWDFVKERKTKPIYEMHPADATREAKQALEDAGYVVVLRSTVLPQFNVVTEREARKREREAFCAGWNVRLRGGDKDGNLANLYPLPSCDKCGQEIK